MGLRVEPFPATVELRNFGHAAADDRAFDQFQQTVTASSATTFHPPDLTNSVDNNDGIDSLQQNIKDTDDVLPRMRRDIITSLSAYFDEPISKFDINRRRREFLMLFRLLGGVRNIDSRAAECLVRQIKEILIFQFPKKLPKPGASFPKNSFLSRMSVKQKLSGESVTEIETSTILRTVMKIIWIVLFAVRLLVLWNLLEGAELKKYLVLKYNYKNAAMFLLWIATDIEFNPGPVGETFSETIRPAVKKLCSRLLKIYQNPKSQISLKDLWSRQADFDLYDIQQNKAYNLSYNTLEAEVLIDILIVCCKKRNCETEELKQELQDWEECNFFALSDHHALMDNIDKITIKFNRLKKFVNESDITTQLSQFGIQFSSTDFQSWTLNHGTMETGRKADIVTEAIRNITGVLGKVLDKKFDPNNDKKGKNLQEMFLEISEECREKYPNHKDLKDLRDEIEDCTGWIHNKKSQDNLIERYLLRHCTCQIEKRLRNLKEKDLIKKAATLLEERGIKLSTEWIQDVDLAPVSNNRKRKHIDNSVFCKDEGEVLKPKMSTKEKKLREEGTIYIILDRSKLKIRTHGYFPDYKKLSKKGLKETQIPASAQLQIRFDETETEERPFIQFHKNDTSTLATTNNPPDLKNTIFNSDDADSQRQHCSANSVVNVEKNKHLQNYTNICISVEASCSENPDRKTLDEILDEFDSNEDGNVTLDIGDQLSFVQEKPTLNDVTISDHKTFDNCTTNNTRDDLFQFFESLSPNDRSFQEGNDLTDSFLNYFIDNSREDTTQDKSEANSFAKLQKDLDFLDYV